VLLRIETNNNLELKLQICCHFIKRTSRDYAASVFLGQSSTPDCYKSSWVADNNYEWKEKCPRSDDCWADCNNCWMK